MLSLAFALSRSPRTLSLNGRERRAATSKSFLSTRSKCIACRAPFSIYFVLLLPVRRLGRFPTVLYGLLFSPHSRLETRRQEGKKKPSPLHVLHMATRSIDAAQSSCCGRASLPTSTLRAHHGRCEWNPQTHNMRLLYVVYGISHIWETAAIDNLS